MTATVSEADRDRLMHQYANALRHLRLAAQEIARPLLDNGCDIHDVHNVVRQVAQAGVTGAWQERQGKS